MLEKCIMWDAFLKKSCRTCLKVDEVELFDWKTERFDKKYNYAECFQEVTQLSLSQVMPQKLCYDCAYELRIAYAFLNRAKRVHLKLLSYRDKSQKYKLCNSTHEKSALFEMPTVDLDGTAQTSPACATVQIDDSLAHLVAQTVTDPFNDLEQESFANTTPTQQSIVSGSYQMEPALIQAAPPSQTYKEEPQHQKPHPECVAEQSVGYKTDPNLCGNMLDGTKMETAVDSPSSMELIQEHMANDEEVMADGLLVQREVLEKKSKTAAPSTKKRTLSQNYFCNECGASFTTTSNLKRHQSKQHNYISGALKVNRRRGGIQATSQQCELCKETFPNKSKFSYHMLRTHEEWLCHACPRISKSKHALERHVKIHDEHRERKFGCEVCGIKCLSATILRGHMQVHEKDRKPKYACDECDKTFYARSGLVLHKRRHTGETVSCKECGRAFPRLVDLKVHMTSHSKERPYQCDICDQNFVFPYSLKYHKLEHEGVQHKCEQCGKGYRSRNILWYHKRKEHEDPTLQCQVCKKLFRSKNKLKRHIKGVHKISTSEEAEELVIRLETQKKFVGRRKGFFTEK